MNRTTLVATNLAFRLSLLAIVVGIAPRSNATPPSADSPVAAAVRGYFPEVRLRKMHLVRPDLIPYPIVFEYFC